MLTKTASRANAFPGPTNYLPLPAETSGSIVQPGDGTFQSMYIPGALTLEAANAFNTGIMYVYGRVDYTDAFGIPHWATFCRQLTSGGGQGTCPDNLDRTDQNNEINRKSDRL